MAQLDFLTNDDSQDNDLGNLGKISTEFNNYTQALQQYIRSNLPQKLEPIDQSYTKDAMDRFLTTDPFHIPDPIQAEQEIDNVVTNKFQNTKPDFFENNLTLKQTFARNELNREITRGVVQGVMGTDVKSKIETIENDVIKYIDKSIEKQQKAKDFLSEAINTACSTLSQVNSGVNNTQTCQNALSADVQRDMLRIQGYQTKIQAETFAQTIQMNQSQQYSNLNLVNVSQQLEEANRARRVDSSAETGRLLRATTQIGLFVSNTKNTETVNPSQNNL
ncbi:MAG: hypothetical protein DSM106950_14100 [Stigonema ocellatum SAG 48.90 = DSM 106950]|nr:hypothetical protein [Stigonema ocellatum SAG 48.90 = DSM 106950]